MITRKQYMNREYSHDQYYSQFVNEPIYHLVLRQFTAKRLADCSDQEYFNDISIHLWDHMESSWRALVDKSLLKDTGEGWSSATSVCILKAAARQIVVTYVALDMA